MIPKVKMKLLFSILSSFSVATFGCKSNQFNEEVSASEEQHVLGDTKVDRVFKMESCDKAAAEKQRKEIPKTLAYVEGIAKHIVAKVQETGGNVFTNELAWKNLCFLVDTSKAGYGSSNAMMITNSGQMVISAGMIIALKNDAQVAAIVAHELAHLTLGHGVPGVEHAMRKTYFKHKETIDRLRISHYIARQKINEAAVGLPELVKDLWQIEYSKSIAAGEMPPALDELTYAKRLKKQKEKNGESCEVCNKVIAQLSEYEKQKTAMASFVQQLYQLYGQDYSPEDTAHKTEIDADEVGQEFYARAGFDLGHYSKGVKQFLWLKSDSWDQCLEKNFEDLERGLETHPSFCWRIHNSKAEAADHAEDYAKWIDGTGIVTLKVEGMPKRAQVLNELQSHYWKTHRKK